MSIIKENISILVVDDEEMIVTILLNYLGDKGYKVTGIHDSSEAIELVKKSSFDVVFTDLMMPVINGMELVKEINSQNIDTQVIIFTGYASVDSAIDAVQQGVYDYIKKPFRLEEIENVLQHALEKLMLKRENLVLHQKIKRMLSQITMLYDISNIIYQVKEKKYAMEMVFDTLAESMNIYTSLLFEHSADSMDFQANYASKGAKQFKNILKLSTNSCLNGKLLSAEDPTILVNVGKRIELNDTVVDLPEECSRVLFVPIRFQGEMEGFLAIFEEQNHISPFEDELTLLKILSTQIAPILSLRKSKSGTVSVLDETEPSRAMDSLIKAELALSDATDTPVSLAMTRLIAAGVPEDDADFSRTREAWRNLIANQLGPDKTLHWAGIDTLLVMASGGNPVGLDHHLANVREEVERSNIGSKSTVKLSMAYSIITYPFDADTAKKISNKLSSRLFYSASEININQ